MDLLLGISLAINAATFVIVAIAVWVIRRDPVGLVRGFFRAARDFWGHHLYVDKRGRVTVRCDEHAHKTADECELPPEM